MEAAETERLRGADMRRVATPLPRVRQTWDFASGAAASRHVFVSVARASLHSDYTQTRQNLS